MSSLGVKAWPLAGWEDWLVVRELSITQRVVMREDGEIVKTRVQEGALVKIHEGQDGRREVFAETGPVDRWGASRVEIMAEAMIQVKEGKVVFSASRISTPSHDVSTEHGIVYLRLASQALARAWEMEAELRREYDPPEGQ